MATSAQRRPSREVLNRRLQIVQQVLKGKVQTPTLGNMQMEAAVLAGAVKYLQIRNELLEYLIEDHFVTPQHKPIFRALYALAGETEYIDGAILKARLRQTGELYEVAGALDPRIGESIVDKVILDIVPDVELVKEYIVELKRCRMKRRIEELAKSMIADARVGALSQQPVEDVIDQAAAELVVIGQDTPKKPEGLGLRGIWEEAERVKAGEKLPVIPSGWPTLDTAMDGGGRRGEMSIEAAFPGVGKTTQMLNKILNLMLNTVLRAAVYSLEQKPQQLTAKMVAILTGAPYRLIRLREWIGTKWEPAIQDAFRQIAEWESEKRLIIENASGASHQTIRAKVLRLKAGKGIDQVYIDYLQLMTGKANGDAADTINVGRNSNGLKRLAQDAEVFVCAVSQFNRKGREGTEPEVWHLRQSGALEQDADIIQILYNDGVASKHTLLNDGPVIERRRLKLVKNRDGELLVGSKALVLDYITGTQLMREHSWNSNVY